LAVGLAISLMMVLVCGGSIGGLLFFLARRGESVAQQTQAMIQQAGVQTPLPIAPAPPVYDWMTARVLAPVYTAALDAVASHAEVSQRLGEPIEPIEDADELYRRVGTGALQAAGEKIQFDIKGAKETAVVTVVADSQAADSAPGMGYSTYRAAEITVTFRDGSTVQVPPPKEQAGTTIQ
jgi:hypothetical protein